MTATSRRHHRPLLAALALAAAGAAAVPAAASAAPRGSGTEIYGICGGRDLCTVDPSTRKLTRVARGSAGAPYRAVSATPSGRAIAFARGTRVFRAGPRASRPSQVGGGIFPRISPDGRTVTWRAEIQVQQCDPFGGCAQLQTFALFRRASGEARPTVVHSFAFSSAWWGGRLVSQSSRRGADGYDIQLLDASGDDLRPLTADPTRSFTSPAASPDGSLLAVVSEPVASDDDAYAFRGRIELFDLRGGTPARVRTLTEGTTDDAPGFSPDGRQVAFNRGGDLWVAPASGGRARRIARSFVVTGPSWAKRRG